MRVLVRVIVIGFYALAAFGGTEPLHMMKFAAPKKIEILLGSPFSFQHLVKTDPVIEDGVKTGAPFD